jgi:hypothetical protein
VVPGDSLRLCIRTCLTLFKAFSTQQIVWESGILAAWVRFQYGDPQPWCPGVGGEFDVVEQYSQDGVLDGDDDCLACVGASDA